MSVSAISVIQSRIKSSPERSKIAVFKSFRGNVVEFNAVFANTVLTKKRIATCCKDLLGTYRGDDGALNFAADAEEERKAQRNKRI